MYERWILFMTNGFLCHQGGGLVSPRVELPLKSLLLSRTPSQYSALHCLKDPEESPLIRVLVKKKKSSSCLPVMSIVRHFFSNFSSLKYCDLVTAGVSCCLCGSISHVIHLESHFLAQEDNLVLSCSAVFQLSVQPFL